MSGRPVGSSQRAEDAGCSLEAWQQVRGNLNLEISFEFELETIDRRVHEHLRPVEFGNYASLGRTSEGLLCEIVGRASRMESRITVGGYSDGTP